MSTAVVHYQLPVLVVICAANKGCASDVSAVVFLYIVNDNLHTMMQGQRIFSLKMIVAKFKEMRTGRSKSYKSSSLV
jgi:hypothetical protein